MTICRILQSHIFFCISSTLVYGDHFSCAPSETLNTLLHFKETGKNRHVKAAPPCPSQQLCGLTAHVFRHDGVWTFCEGEAPKDPRFRYFRNKTYGAKFYTQTPLLEAGGISRGGGGGGGVLKKPAGV